MARWQFSFVAEGKHFEHLMEMLVPLKVEDLDFKLVAGTATRIRAGDKPAWQIIADMATDKPQPMDTFKVALTRAGFAKNGFYSGMDQALKKKAVRKRVIGGKPHFVRGG